MQVFPKDVFFGGGGGGGGRTDETDCKCDGHTTDVSASGWHPSVLDTLKPGGPPSV